MHRRLPFTAVHSIEKSKSFPAPLRTPAILPRPPFLSFPILDYKGQGQALIGNPVSWFFFAETSHSQVDNSQSYAHILH